MEAKRRCVEGDQVQCKFSARRRRRETRSWGRSGVIRDTVWGPPKKWALYEYETEGEYVIGNAR